MIARHSIVAALMFDYESLSEGDVEEACAELPQKIVRWIAIHHPDNRARVKFYALTGVPVGEDTVINAGVILYDEYKGLVHFGARCAVGSGVVLIASSNPNNSHLARHPHVVRNASKVAPISIGDDTWLGANCVIMPGVNVGQGAIVGAGSVVLSDVPPHCVVAGVPARHVRSL